MEEQPHPKYYLSKIACAGILRRAKERGKELPKQLKDALMIQAGLIEPTIHEYITDKEKMLCLADQGGERMDVEENITPTLRASMSGHPPLVPQPMVIASTKPNAEILDGISPTVTASSGMGGGNGLGCQRDISYTLTTGDIHSVYDMEPYQKVVGALMHRDYKGDVYDCSQWEIKGVIRSGSGQNFVNEDEQKILGTTTGKNTVYVNQDKCIVGPMNESKKLKLFGQSSFGGYDDQVATLTASGGNNGGGSENLALTRNLVRRLTPLECERLQGFPDEWTNVPSASDSARYKALGNSVCIPCVEFVMNKIATFLRKEQIESEDTTCISTPNT